MLTIAEIFALIHAYNVGLKYIVKDVRFNKMLFFARQPLYDKANERFYVNDKMDTDLGNTLVGKYRINADHFPDVKLDDKKVSYWRETAYFLFPELIKTFKDVHKE